jgi:hypothetical protein
MFAVYEIKKTGVYRLCWKVAENKPGSDGKWYRSNDILLTLDPRYKIPDLYIPGGNE